MATWKQLAQMGDLEGVNVLSTTNSNEADTKYLRADGDGTCSWQTVSATIGAAQTGIESIKNTSLVVGRDDDNLIKFGTDNQIIFEVSGGDNVIFKASGEIEATSLDISGAADIDGTITTTAETIQNSGNALLSVISESSDGDSVSAVTLTRNNNSNQVANLGVRDNENIFRITTGSNVGPSYANLGDYSRLAINEVGDGIFMTSTGVGRIGANTISVADDTTVSIAGAGEGAICHIYVYERSNGAGAIYTANYHGPTKLVTQDNPIGGSNPAWHFYAGSSGTDGGINVYKSNSSHTITFENKTGGTRTFKIMVVGAGQAAVI